MLPFYSVYATTCMLLYNVVQDGGSMKVAVGMCYHSVLNAFWTKYNLKDLQMLLKILLSLTMVAFKW